jgi:hypothetical protein
VGYVPVTYASVRRAATGAGTVHGSPNGG